MSWELSIIGTAMADNNSMDEASSLRPSDFTGPNRVVWANMLELRRQGVFDMRSVSNVLQIPGWRSICDRDPEDYLNEALAYRGNTMSQYVTKVLDASVKRSVREECALIAVSAEDERVSVDDVLDNAERKLMALRRTNVDTGTDLGQIIAAFMPRLDQMRAGTFQPAWTPGVVAVKGVMDFMEASDFFIVAGRPGEGKSSYLRAEANELDLKMAPGNNKKIVIINMENDPVEYARYLISLRTGLDSRKLRDARTLTDPELDLVKRTAVGLANSHIKVVTMAGPSVAEVVRVMRKISMEFGIEVGMVDYIQLMNNGNENRVQDIGITTRGLRGYALGANVPLIAACQLSRAIETRNGGDSDPQLSDLRDSGEIEQDATTVGFLRSMWKSPTVAQIKVFPENVNAQGALLPRIKAMPIRMFVAKNRNGETGPTEPIKWVKANGRFMTLTGFTL